MLSVWRSARRAFILTSAAVFIVAPVGVVDAQSAPAQPDRPGGQGASEVDAVPGEYVVMLRSESSAGVSRQSAESLSTRIDVVMSRLNTALGSRNKRESTAQAGDPIIAELPVVDGFAARLNAVEAAILSGDPEVVSVEPNIKVALSSVPTVTPLDGPGELPWGLDRIDQPALPLDGSYTPPNEGSGVTAYVLDDGVWIDHQEFAGRINPIIDFVGGYQSVDDIPPDCMSHGTHVAGTIAGSSVGVAPGATIQPVRVLDCFGTGSLIGILRGMDWVFENAEPPAVVNMSLGGGRSLASNSATESLTAKGITVAVSAGNSQRDACGFSPASVPSAITVAASTVDDKPVRFSNYGPCVDLYAPGVDVISASVDGRDQYSSMSGTSMASPHVAGTAALYLAAHPAAKPAAVQQAILAGAADGVLAGVNPSTPNKMVQVNDLPDPTVVTDDAPVAHITPPSDVGDVAQIGSEVTFDGSSSFDPLGGSLTYEWRVQGQEGVAGSGPTITATPRLRGVFEVVLTVTNTSGVQASTTYELFVDDLRPPVVQIDPPERLVRANAGDELSWDASASYDPDGGSLTFRWYLYNQDSFEIEMESDGPVFEITYPGGDYAAVAIATNEFGVEEGDGIDLRDLADPVAVIIPAETEAVVGETVSFDGSASYDNFTQDGASLGYRWTTDEPSGDIGYDPQWEREFYEAGKFTITLQVTSITGETDTATATITVTDAPPEPPEPALTSVDPGRVLDTRRNHPEIPGPKGTVGGGQQVKFSMIGVVPASASGVMLNVTAVAPQADGHLTVYPCGARPNTSNLNYHQGVTRGNSVLTALSPERDLCIWTYASADIVVDVTGFAGAESPTHSLSPVRAFDTRTSEFGGTGPVAAGATVEVPVTALSEVPDDASAVFLNLAAAGPSADGHLTAYPCGDVPPTSSLNYRAGETLSTQAIVAVSDAGTVCVRSYAMTDVVVDVLGYVDAGDWIQMVSDRKFDTRAKYPDIAPMAKGAVAAGDTVKVDLGIDPAETAGVFLTVTAVAPQRDGHLTVYPCGEQPTVSGLNYRSGVTTSNMVFAKVDDTGSVCVFTHATTDLVVDYIGTVVIPGLKGTP